MIMTAIEIIKAEDFTARADAARQRWITAGATNIVTRMAKALSDADEAHLREDIIARPIDFLTILLNSMENQEMGEMASAILRGAGYKSTFDDGDRDDRPSVNINMRR